MCTAAEPEAMPNGRPSKESGGSTSEESVSIDSSDGSSEEEETRTHAPEPKHGPPAEPLGSPPRVDQDRGRDQLRHGKGRGKDRSKGPRTDRCQYCWKRVKGGEHAMAQHCWWNESCLTWQFHRAGHSWSDAKREAASTKRLRMEDRSSSEGRYDEPPPRGGRTRGRKAVDKSWVLPDAHPKSKKESSRRKDSKKEKSKKKKKGRKHGSSASPDHVRGKHRRHPSTDSSSGGKRKDRDRKAKRETPRTLVIRLPGS